MLTEANTSQLVIAFVWFALLTLAAAAGVASSYSGFIRYVLVVPLVAFAIWLVVHGFMLTRRAILVYERGLVVRDAKNVERAVPLDDVRGVAWSAVETFVNGFHNHTQKSLALTLRTGETISVGQQVKRRDKTFDQVRDLISEHVARTMEASLRKEGRVQWVPGVEIAPDELRIDGAFVQGQHQVRKVARPERLRHHFSDGTYQLYVDSNPEPVIAVPCAAQNLFPGLMLLTRLWKDRRGLADRAQRG